MAKKKAKKKATKTITAQIVRERIERQGEIGTLSVSAAADETLTIHSISRVGIKVLESPDEINPGWEVTYSLMSET